MMRSSHFTDAMPYQPGGKTSFYKESFQIAYASKSKLSAEDYGRWTPATFRLKGDDRDALAYVQPDYAAAGTELFAMVRGKPVPMVVTPTPFVPTRYHRG